MLNHGNKSSGENRWGAFELAWYSFCCLLLAFTAQRFSTGEWFGTHPWAGAAIVVWFVTIPVALDAASIAGKCLRFFAPTVLLYFFYVRGSGESGFIDAVRSAVGFKEFALLFLASLVAALFTSEKEAEVQESERISGQAPEPPKRVPTPPPSNGDPFARIIGQEHVIAPLKDIAKMARADIRVGKRNAPHAVLLFLGPTGVGKTEAARALTEAVFGSSNAMIRFDMGQFTDAHQANRFYGPPPGYVGSDKGGQLTQAVLKKPRALVLLDEVEKAHSQIWDAFLPVFDEGYVVDGSFNKKVDMTNTVIVLTSNLLAGEAGIEERAPFEIKEAVEATGAFRPELLGRINEILVFKPLGTEAIAEILKQRLDAALWGLSEQGISITVDESQMRELVERVKQAKFGVRQIDDVVRSHLRKVIAEQRGEAAPVD